MEWVWHKLIAGKLKVFKKDKAMLHVIVTTACYLVTSAQKDLMHSDQTPVANFGEIQSAVKM